MNTHPKPADMAREDYPVIDNMSDAALSSMHHARAHHAGGISVERRRIKADLLARADALRSEAHEAIGAAKTTADVARAGQMTGEAKALREYAEGLS